MKDQSRWMLLLGCAAALTGCNLNFGPYTTLDMELNVVPAAGGKITGTGSWDVVIHESASENRGLIHQKSASGSGSRESNLLTATELSGAESLSVKFDFSLANIFMFGPVGSTMQIQLDEEQPGLIAVDVNVDDVVFDNGTFQSHMSVKGEFESMSKIGSFPPPETQGGDYEGKLMISLDCENEFTGGCPTGNPEPFSEGTLTLVNGEDACPASVVALYAQGNECSFSGGGLDLGGEAIACQRAGEFGYFCHAEKSGFEGDGCTWEVRVVGNMLHAGTIIAKSDEGCELPHCTAPFTCFPK